MDLRLVTPEEAAAPGTINPVEGDLYLDEHGDVPWLDGRDAIAQHIRIRLRFFYGEWFQNTDEGIPYFQELLEKGAQDRAEAILRKVVLGTPGVVALNAFAVVFDNAKRSGVVTFEAAISDGSALVSGDYGTFVVSF